MTEPWGTIWVVTCLGVFAIAGLILLYWAIRLRSVSLGLLCAALVVWPIAGEVLCSAAQQYVRQTPRFGDTAIFGLWEDSAGGFLTKVAVLVHSVQVGLVLAASIAIVRSMRKDS